MPSFFNLLSKDHLALPGLSFLPTQPSSSLGLLLKHRLALPGSLSYTHTQPLSSLGLLSKHRLALPGQPFLHTHPTAILPRLAPGHNSTAMCFNNTDLVVCGTPLSFYQGKRKDTRVQFCLETRASILMTIVEKNAFPPSVHHADFDIFLRQLRGICHLEHGSEFAAVVHPFFAKTVRDYITRWMGKKNVWVCAPDGTHVWNQDVLDRHFKTMTAMKAWLRTHGSQEPWERETTRRLESCLDEIVNLDASPWVSCLCISALIMLIQDKESRKKSEGSTTRPTASRRRNRCQRRPRERRSRV
ncbi:hypothetical protein QBC39DRAFT_364405 [Podospora conica]|nr:hypothetical protein QBC39DRAFT_364405 [Schizothecium conicum]